MAEDEHTHDQDDVEEPAEPADPEEAAREAERQLRKRIALAQIRQYGDPSLRMRAQEVETFDDELARVTERMIGLMHDADGVGLAATQIGILRRFFVFHDEESGDHVIVNPKITERGEELETDEEGCLSLGAVRVLVERSLHATIEGKDASGQPVRFELEGLPARVVQHEVDHLDGVLILDRTDSTSRKEALAQLRPRLLLATR
jgi:peptide deformylase